MIIYSDQFEKPKIPSDVYMSVADFSVILNDIAKGVIPTGSRIPYSLFSDDDIRRMNQNGQNPPWENNVGIKEYNGPLSPYSAGL